MPPTAPASAASAEELSSAVDAIARGRDADSWSLARWQDENGLPGIAVFRRGLRWIDHPTLDRHHVLTCSYAAQLNGLPLDSSTLDELRAAEGGLEATCGPRSILVGHETHGGMRLFHVYSDGEDQNVDAALSDFSSSHGMSLESRPDPAWTEVRHLTG